MAWDPAGRISATASIILSFKTSVSGRGIVYAGINDYGLSLNDSK